MEGKEIKREYFEWLLDKIGYKRFAPELSFRKLLTRLHETEFTYTRRNDGNRAQDGIDLRYRFAVDKGYKDKSKWVLRVLDGPCSVLEMMAALAIRCEERIMDDPAKGNRTGQWFWGMVNNLGLGSMVDDHYDEKRVDQTVRRLLKRKYDPDGKGGLFYVRGCTKDLRKVEIWYQLCWYLDTII